MDSHCSLNILSLLHMSCQSLSFGPASRTNSLTHGHGQMHTRDLLAAGLPHANFPVAGTGSSFSTRVSQSTLRRSSPSSSWLGLPWSSSGGLAHGDRLWGDPNSLSHGILVMSDSSGPQGESCLCGAGSGHMYPRGYCGSLSCQGASGLTLCCRWEGSSDGGNGAEKDLGSPCKLILCSFGCMWSIFFITTI